MTLAKLALWFVGNASVQISRERRKRAIKKMNSKLAEKDSIYKKAAAMLLSLSSPRRQRRERTSGGPWTGLLTILTLKDLRIFRAATLTVSMEGWHEPKPPRLPVQSRRGRFRPYQLRAANPGKENFAPRERGKSQ